MKLSCCYRSILNEKCRMSDSLKIRIDLHESDKTTTKIWRFNANLAKVYTVKRVEDEIVQLFPHLHDS